MTSNVYTTLDDVLEDIDCAVTDVMEKLELPNGAARNQYMPISPEKNSLSLKFLAFKKRAHDLVQNDRASRQKQKSANGTNGYSTNGGLGSNAFTQVNATAGANKVVLTLYGTVNAPQPKQLFSSLQSTRKIAGENQVITQTLREAGLPNGISTTQIIPIKSTGLADDKKRPQTLGDIFPTPPTVPALQPPKPSKIGTTRSSTVGWYQPASADLPSRNGSYFRQSISTGQWLDYSNASPPQSTKRRPRDRAMSLGGAKAPHLDPEPAESETAKLEALFRGAYSGFAPTRDDTAAIVPNGTMDRIWWQQIGEKSFERLVENAKTLDEVVVTDSPAAESAIVHEVDEDEKFRQVVEQLEAEAIDPSLEAPAEKSAEEKDVEEILDGISELLETLNSYQRIRHMSLNTSGRPAGLLSAPDTTSLGTPSRPSEPEMATYEILKTQLTMMIATLPPFAVAKLDPDQLAELSISTKIPIQVENYKGVMEEDEASARAKVNALSAASATSRPSQPAPLQRPSSAALYGNQYTPRPAVPAAHQYYGSQTPIRPPVTNIQRPPSTGPAPYPSQRPAGAPYRPGSYGTPTYPHQAPRPVPQQYGPSHPPQYIQTPSAPGYARSAGQSYQSMPHSATQATMSARYPNQPSYPQQSPTHNSVDYRYGNGVSTGRQTSPQKPLYSPGQNSAQVQPRPSYSTPTPIAQDRRSYLQNPLAQSPMVNGGSSQSPQPQHAVQQALGPTNYSTFMTTEQQSHMMERQRAHLAAQQETQQQARQLAQAAMGSPPKAQVNGSAVAAGL